MIRVLELRSVWGTGGGPEKTILRGTERADRRRFAITVCYIRDARDTVFGIGALATRFDIDYVELVERHSLDRRLWTGLKQVVRERAIDIVHAHEYKTDLLARWLARGGRVIPLATAHGWTGHSARERFFYYPMDKRLLARFPRVIAVSEEIRRELLAHGAKPERVTTILNGIEPDAFERDPAKAPAIRAALGLMDDRIVVGSVGRLEPQKRFDLLISSIARLRTTYPALTLLIAGDGSLRNALEKQVSDLGLGDACRLLGHRTDVADLHHAFNLYVQSSDYEGTPNAVLEAMALESPVVATAAGGTAEILHDGIHGVVVPCDDGDALTRAIAGALDDPAAARTRAAAARQRVETDLSFETRTRKVEAIYDELMRGRMSG
jgi:glycosyltransferase involved in cell wall biosynthesis